VVDDGSATDDLVRRDVSAHLEADIATEADLAFAIAVAGTHAIDEALTVQVDGEDLAPTLVLAPHGGRLHLLRDVRPGRLVVDYYASVKGAATPAPPSELDWFQYVRPSRYCESDRLGPFARAEFGGRDPHELLAAGASWVGVNIAYVPGATRPIDGAVATLLGRAGVCRDFAHLTAALLRANGVAARTVSVYAPGLDPMDFHAVVEAAIDGRWWVVDSTCLAPRQAMVRIATGADASDTAFLTSVRGIIELDVIEVTATAWPHLPVDDVHALVSLT
jgi:transglutaminase-like putative cysteine protease